MGKLSSYSRGVLQAALGCAFEALANGNIVCITNSNKIDFAAMRGPKIQLLLVSFLILFLELTLIRFLPAQIFYLGYYSNFILIASFVGMGTGILLARRQQIGLYFFPWLLGFLIAVSCLFSVSISPDERGDLHFVGIRLTRGCAPWNVPEYIAVPMIFILVCLVFIFLSQKLGRLLNSLPPLTAYTWNIMGSLVGIAGFAVCAIFRTNPYVWLTIVFILFLIVSFDSPRCWLYSLIPMTLTLFLTHGAIANSIWSPYQKITAVKMEGDQGPQKELYGYRVFVNNISHQAIFNQEKYIPGYYLSPYMHFHSPCYPKTLIIGAGGGNDSVIALRRGGRAFRRRGN